MANSDKNIRITTSKNKTTYPNIVFTGSAAGSSVITLEVLDDNTLSFTSNEGQVFSIDSNLSTGTIWAVSDISGVPMLSSSAGGTVGLATYGGIVGIGQTNPTYKLDLKGSFGLASSNDGLYNFIFSNSAASGSNSLQIRSANSIFLYNSGNSFYTGIKSNAAANVTYTLPTNDGSADQFLKTNGSGILSWGTPAGGSGGGSTGVGQGGQYEVAYYPGTGASVIGNTNLKNNTATSVVSVSYSTASLDFSTGAFTVSGGVGIGGSLFVGGIGASISGITFSNSLITRGTWNATVISPQYGGTGQNFSSSTGLLRYSSGTASVITTSSDLANVISDETGSGALVFATGPALVTPNIGAATGTSLYLSATSPSNSITTGAIIVPGGVGIGLSVSIGGRLQLFNGANYTAFVSSASGNTVYTLPASSPATGTSVLQSTAAGVLSWVPMVAGSSGAGSGTVAIPDAQYRIAYYAGTGASVSSTNLITAVGTGVTILGTTNASSTTVAALSIIGGLGVTGNAFIGGTTSVTSTQTSISTNSGALVVTGGVGIGGSLYTGTTVASSISGVVLSNGLVTSGTWSGTVITALYGGTGFNSYAVGDLLVASTGTSLAKLAASSNSGYVLTSTGANSVPTWQAVPPAAATSVAVAPTTVNGQFSITTVNSASGTGLGLSTISTFVVNPSSGLVTISGLAVTNGTNSSSTTTGTLNVYGGLGITGNAFIGGTINVASTNASVISGISFVNGAITVGAWNATVISPTYGGTGQNYGSSSGILKYTTGTASLVTAPTGTLVGTTDSQNLTNKTYNGVTITAPATNATLTLADTTTLTTSGAFNLTLTTTALTNVTFPSGTKTLVATDVTSLSSLTTASSLNSIGTITSGTWAGTVITSLYGGTGFNSYAVGDLLVASTGTSLARLAASSNSGYVLTSTGANSVPTWQAVPPAAATSVAVAPTTVNGQFSITAVNSASGTGLGLSTISTLVINPSSGLVTVSGLAVTNGNNSSSTTTGTLTVYGGLGITGNAFIGGTTNVTSSVASIGTNSGALVVTGGVGIGGSLYTGTSVASSISGVIHSNGAVTGSSYNKVAITAPATSATLTLSNGSSLITSGGHSLTFTTTNTTNVTVPTTGTLATTSNKLSDFAATTSLELLNTITGETGSGALVFATSPEFTTSVTTGSATFSVFNANATNISAFGAATTLSIGANSGKATFNSADNSTSTTTGAIVATGGAAVGQSLSIGGRLQIFNATNYSAFRYTGTANTTYTLPLNSPQASVGTSVLASTIDGTMSWIGLPVASGSGSPGGSDTQVQYNASGSFAGATGMTWNNGSNLLTLAATTTLTTSTQTALRIANINNTDPTNNIRWSPAFEMVGLAGASPGFGQTYNTRFAMEVVPLGPSNYSAYLRTRYSFDLRTASPSYNNDLFRIHSNFGIGIGASNSNSNAISYFRVNTDQTGELTYILPPSYPATGTSVLQSDTSGTLLWVGVASGSPGGSGTVNSGTGGSFAFYATTGTAVNGSSLITVGGAGVTIGSTLNASSTVAAALSVRGGIGITGNAFIGGTTNITSTTEAISITSGALTVAGGAGIAKSLFVGTTLAVGATPTYNITNNLASFVSSVNTYNQVVIQNKSNGSSASADFVLNNDQSTDTTFYGNLGINSSTFSGSGALAVPNAVYLSSTSGPLVLGTTTAHPIRFVVNGSATDMIYIDGAGTAISVFANLGLRSASDLRFWNSGNTFYAGLQGGASTVSYLLSMPTAPVAAGASAMIVGSDGQMYFAAPGAGIAFSNATSNTATLRAKRALNLQFCSGFTPAAAGADTAILRIPESASDGITQITYNLRRFQVRVETPSAGSSRLQLERSSSDTGAFALAASGSSHIGGLGVTITGAGIYLTSVTSFSGTFVTSGNLLRLNWTLLNATHANFSINLVLEEV